MGKPKLEMPKREDYHVDSGLHMAMRQWAKAHERPGLLLWIRYRDPDEQDFVLHTFEPADREVSYLALDGETYEQRVHCATGYRADAYVPLYDKREDYCALAELKRIIRASKMVGKDPKVVKWWLVKEGV